MIFKIREVIFVTNMKQEFASALMEMLEKVPLEDITVKDIVSRCGVSRQSFYYYFNDIYDIVEWIFLQETEKEVAEYSNINTWYFGYMLVLKWIKKNRLLVLNTYKSVRRDYIENFLNRVLYPYIEKVVEEQAQGMRVTKEQKEFIANFYTIAINAISLEWINKGLKENPEEISERVGIIIKGSCKKALINFQDKNPMD